MRELAANGGIAAPMAVALGGRKMQETLRQLREQWKQVTQGGNAQPWIVESLTRPAMCPQGGGSLDWTRLHRIGRAKAQPGLDRRDQSVGARERPISGDWKAINRALRQFGDRWRESGHVGEKVFAELQPLWKQAIALAAQPFEKAQAESLARRQTMIEEAVALGADPVLRIDAIKALQQRWQAEAHVVPWIGARSKALGCFPQADR